MSKTSKAPRKTSKAQTGAPLTIVAPPELITEGRPSETTGALALMAPPELNSVNENAAPVMSADDMLNAFMTAPPGATIDAPPRKAPQIKLSARQRTNVDQFDNGAQTSAGAINSVLLDATRPMTRDEIVNESLRIAPERFDKLKAPGRVSNHLRHLLQRALVELVNGAWRVRADARELLTSK